MDNVEVQVEIDHQLDRLVGELEADYAREGRVNTFLFLSAGEVADLLGRPDLSERLRANLPAVT